MDVPEQTHKTVYIELSDAQKKAIKEMNNSEADPMVRRARIRTIENGVLYGKKIEEVSENEDRLVKDVIVFPSNKIDYILERAIEFKKLVVFANYTAQIEEISKALKKEGYNVFSLTGQSKNRGDIIKDAESAESAIIVIQTSISAGYELPSFPCVIYASKPKWFVDYFQSLGRVLRANKLKKNLYIHLVVKGGPDEDSHKAMMNGEDFQEKLSVL